MRTQLKWSMAALVCLAATAGAQDQVRTARVEPAKGTTASQPTLYFLALRGGVIRASADGSQPKTLVPLDAAGVGPDGIAIDPAAGHVYWTNMGKVSADDGSVMRSDLDGRNVKAIVPVGGTFTPKQLKLDAVNKKLYWSDREGMRVMRSNLDGSNIETLVITGSGDAQRNDGSLWCVGIAIDVEGGKVYWSQKGGDNAGTGTIKRANLNMPKGQSATNRTDIEIMFANLPEPIDLDIDERKRLLYWTDRGDNTISRAPLNPPAKFDAKTRKDREILMRDVGEAIGIALDLDRDRLYYTSLGGVVGTATLDGRNARTLLTEQGGLTGIALLK